MKILLAINNLGTGGAETFFCQLARALAEKGHSVFVWQIFYPIEDHQYQQVLNHPKIELFKMDTSEVKELANNSKSISRRWKKRKLNKRLQSLGIQLVNSHLFESDYFISTNVNLPHVVSMHGSYEMYLNNLQAFEKDSFYGQGNLKNMCEQIFSRTHHVITAAQKNELAFTICKNYPLNSRIYYGRTQMLHKNEATSIQTIGMVSRGIASKGWRILFESFIQLSKENKKLHLQIGYTDSEFMIGLKNEYAGLESVSWHENVKNTEDFLKNVDLFVFPTLYPAESLPNVVIEALASNVPVISTNIGEIANMVFSPNGNAGIVISKDLSEEELICEFSSVIKKLLDEPNHYVELKQHCKEAFEKFDIDLNSMKYLHIFNKALNGEK